MWILIGTLIYIVFWLTCIVTYAVHYLSDTIQITSFTQVIYTLTAGTEGAEGTMGLAVGGFFKSYWLLLLAGTAVFAYYIYLCVQKHKAKKEGVAFFKQPRTQRVFNCSVLGAAVIVSSLFGTQLYQGWQVLKVDDYLQNVNRESTIYDDNFVEPDSVNITFPQKKKNLVHIVIESMESSYTDREHGGGYDEDLIPGLYSLAKEGTDFSPKGTTEINGANVTANSGWTVAGLVAMSAAVPLNVGNGDFNRNFNNKDKFMPHLITMGDILEENGYSNYFMCGSDASFAGRRNYYQQHGNYEILDHAEAMKEKAIPQGYSVWWGFEDEKLFDWAEKKLSDIAKKDEPFNFTVLTADTHFPNGYPCDLCEDEFDSQYENVVACTDRQVTNFVRWLQKQPFYDNTTVVITGDHLSMDGSVAKTTGADYDRHSYAIVLNGPEYTLDKTREFCTLDLYPTIMEALGIQIEGHRLGLGTSLYSDVPTLIEQLGLLELNAELVADSSYYNNVIMSGDQTKVEEKKEEPKKEAEKTSEDKKEEEVYQQVETNQNIPAAVPPYYQPTDSWADQGYTPIVPDVPVENPGTPSDQGTSETPIVPDEPNVVPPTDPGTPTDPVPPTDSEVPSDPGTGVPDTPAVPEVPANPGTGSGDVVLE
ncbi:MAG: sulfatase-like hydrolase/transferase [Allobaculum sp.]